MKIKAENAARFAQHCILLLELSGEVLPYVGSDRNDKIALDPQTFRGAAYRGMKIYEKLRRLENKAHYFAEDECNGRRRTTGKEISEAESEAFSGKIHKQVMALLPNLKHFHLNGDPRGYALKVGAWASDPEKEKYIRDIGIYQDFGGFGILAPEF